MIFFESFPDDSRVWIYVADRSLDVSMQEKLVAHMSGFTRSWTYHENPVDGDLVFLESRILILAANLGDGDISGCGIDASVHALDRFAQANGFTWLSSLYVLVETPDKRVVSLSRKEARKLAADGEITPHTVVFDTAIGNLGTLRKNGLKKHAGDSWHAAIFRFPAITSESSTL